MNRSTNFATNTRILFIKLYNLRKQQKIYMTFGLVMSCNTQQKKPTYPIRNIHYFKYWLFCCVLELITRPKVMESFCCFLKLYSFLNGIPVLVAKFVLLFISFFLINSYLFLVDWSLLYNIGLICHTSTRTNHRRTRVPSLWKLPPTSHPSPPL